MDEEKKQELLKIHEALCDEIHLFCDNFCSKYDIDKQFVILEIPRIIIGTHLDSQGSVEKRNNLARKWKIEIDIMMELMAKNDH